MYNDGNNGVVVLPSSDIDIVVKVSSNPAPPAPDVKRTVQERRQANEILHLFTVQLQEYPLPVFPGGLAQLVLPPWCPPS